MWTTWAGSFRLPRNGCGDEIGTVGLDQNSIGRNWAATARRASDFLNVTMPAKLMYSPIASISAPSRPRR